MIDQKVMLEKITGLRQATALGAGVIALAFLSTAYVVQGGDLVAIAVTVFVCTLLAGAVGFMAAICLFVATI